MQIIEVKISDKEKWNNFVLANQGEFLQSWEWGEFQVATGKMIWRLAAVGENNEFIATVLVIKNELPLGKNYLYCPRGPILKMTNDKLQMSNEFQNQNFKILKLIFNRIREVGEKNNSVFLKWEPAILSCHSGYAIPLGGIFVSGSEKDRFRNKFGMTENVSANFQPHDSLVLDLDKTEEELLAQMKQKTRYNIRLAEKHGVKVRMSDEKTFESDFEKFWALTEETTARDKFQSHAKEYYRKMMDVLNEEILLSALVANPHTNLEKNQLEKDDLVIKSLRLDDFSTGRIGMGARLFLAEFEEKILAANIMIFFGTRATYLHGASGAEYRNLMAPYLLQWEQIKKARQMGYKEYDFWGIASKNQKPITNNQNSSTTNYKKEWEGITRFKTGFGGKEINYPEAIDIIYQPMVYKTIKIAKKAVRIFRK